MSFGDFWEKKILDLLLSNTAYTIPANVFVALSTSTPADDGTNVTEPSGNNYSRVSVTNNATNWPAATGTSPTSKANGTAVTFPQASGSWGTVTHFCLYDASSAGNFLAWGALAASKAVGLNDTASFAIGDLSFTLD
jgi:hypothetical protein